jgi:hypothetical protein
MAYIVLTGPGSMLLVKNVERSGFHEKLIIQIEKTG